MLLHGLSQFHQEWGAWGLGKLASPPKVTSISQVWWNETTPMTEATCKMITTGGQWPRSEGPSEAVHMPQREFISLLLKLSLGPQAHSLKHYQWGRSSLSVDLSFGYRHDSFITPWCLRNLSSWVNQFDSKTNMIQCHKIIIPVCSMLWRERIRLSN